MVLLKSVLWALKALVTIAFVMLVLNVVFGVTLFSDLIFSYSGMAIIFFFAVCVGLWMYY
ncbi:MAG: hypothetical protein J4215_01025 [Candidatus Diapherotrites archaeon]|uniref:Uncharacterized protein n=1 Tax=Candidatus Iainarchaeum sp. TaxID=3101447 RepID=A0A8T4LE21_9ARCH|nr:hypothetical protein [Candidatus Diapherotrites archaeon]